ncbi:TonB-dependent siderophore receptor [Rhodoblastus acidophilus]|uniref:TonB-dependent receptor n=1 Tax=Candidatus Rhodoblastus alkanivorans TaxID=2954117 RepID=UPI001FA9ED43|nr:TonB-dependent siderophore receptor [Candidatus Rhodoblastus alkanivorans]MCI4680395.1 TonB-dependent siderophore receptor [Candidatus Rhodoblastus alkanivorans]
MPPIDVGGARRGARVLPTTRASIGAAAPSVQGTPGDRPLFPATALGRGPTDVVGYFVGGTSTATKTNTPILDIPQSISIITQQQLQDRNSVSLNQALTYVPGVTVTGGEGNKDAISIRGQNTTADFYRDGVRDDAEYYRDLYNIRAVEVLKGPSALIFGRGGGGGIVNRVTKKADGETIREIGGSFGSFGRKRVTVDIGQAISDTLALRLNALYENSYGFRNFFHLERYGVNPTLTWKPLKDTFVTLSYEHYRDWRTNDRGIPSIGMGSFFGGFPAGLAASFPGHPAPTANYTFFGDANPSATTNNFSKVDVNIVDLDIQHKTDFGLEIRNHTVYANYQKRYANTFAGENVLLFEGPPGGQMEIEGYAHNTPRRNIFNQTDLVYRWQMTPEIKHTFLVGSEVGNQRSSSERNLSCFGTPDNSFVINCDGSASAVDAPFLAPTIYYPMIYGDPRERRYTDLMVASGYLQDQIAITQFIDVLAGIRFDRFDLNFRGADFPLPPGANPRGQATEQAEGEIVDPLNQTIRVVNNKWSPRLGIVFKPIADLSFYGAYSRSFLPQSSDQFVVITPSLAALQPQSFENFEVGAKYQITSSLLLTIALYNLNRSNQPLTVSAFNAVAADTRTRGGEISLVGYMSDEWQVSLGYGHQSARVLSTSNFPSVNDPFLIYAGKVTPNVPRDTFSFWNKYDVSPLVDLRPGVIGLGAGVIYNAKFYPAVDNAVVVPGYARLDAAAYWKVTEKITAQLNVENLLGAHYFVAATNNNNIMPGAPRSAYVTLNARF